MREDKELAIKLRRKGKSYNEIHAALGIPKSTLSDWFKDLRFSKDIKINLINESKRKWAQNITDYNKNRAILIAEETKKTQLSESAKIKDISKRELWLLGTALYWAEGSKRQRWQARFTNSDPEMIKLIMKFFRAICEVKDSKFRLTLQIHSNVSEESAREYWSDITKIPPSQFHKTMTAVSKSSKGIRSPRRLPYGTLRVSVADVAVVNRIKGWIKGLSRTSGRS